MNPNDPDPSATRLRIFSILGVVATALLIAAFLLMSQRHMRQEASDSRPQSDASPADVQSTDATSPPAAAVPERAAEQSGSTADQAEPAIDPKGGQNPSLAGTARRDITDGQPSLHDRSGSENHDGSDPETASRTESLADVLDDPTIDWQDPEARARAVARMKAAEDRDLAKATRLAEQLGKPLVEEIPGGKRELAGLDEHGELLYVETKNANAAISTAANLLHPLPYALDGAGLTVGVWDGDSALVTHQEFNESGTSRVRNVNNQPTNDHATHVTGTIAAYGVDPLAKGMAPKILVDSYDWTNDDSEMAAAGAFNAGQFDTKVYLSNHSYGFSYGWRINSSGQNEFVGTGSNQNAYDPKFGRYSQVSDDMDTIVYNAPYYTIFWAAGNENTDGPSNGNTVVINGTTTTYNSSIHPPRDGNYRNGFETVGDESVSKNLIVIGAANDAVTNGQRDPSKSTKVNFSSTGPTDDGRIKPDLMANGAALYSTRNTSDTGYGNKSGTSMASPNACGSAALLVELYRELFGGSAAMRASTLKALLIHTATDLANPGPDYTTGWGLIDVKTAADLLQRQADFPDLESVVEDQLTNAQPTDTFSFAWDGTSPIRATLCWTDPPGTSDGNIHDERTPDLVNNLNLKLIAPDGSEHFPFVMPFVGTWTVASMGQHATTGVNNVDNVEQVLVSTPGQLGLWRAEITYAGTLTNGVQQYGLIISGSGASGNLVFNPASYSVLENAGFATISVERQGGISGACSVDYSTADGTAIAGSDYTATSGTLAWNDGEGGTKSFNIPILNDATAETFRETVSVTLSNASGIAVAGTNAATLTILDDETAMGITSFNNGGTFATGTQQNITWTSTLAGNVRIELLRNGVNYTTIASSTDNDGTFSWTVPLLAPTGGGYSIRITSLAGGGEFDESDGTFSVENQSNGTFYSADMSTNPGWTLQGQWAYGTPSGNGEDPSSGFTGPNVIGYNLAGDYGNNLSETHATTPAIDCSQHTNVTLSFRRWLAIESSSWDEASVSVSNNGTSWTPVWTHSGATFNDNAWLLQTYDLSAVADGQPTVYVRWTMGDTDRTVTYGGWNLDDVTLSGSGPGINPAGELAFSSANTTVAEQAGSATITVERRNGSSGAVSIDYSTSDGTATAGSDYTATSGTLSWADGDSATKSFSVPISNDAAHEEFLETVTLTLSNTVGATIGNPNPATLSIEDDDNNPPSVDAGPDQTVEWLTVSPTPGLYYGTVAGNIDVTTPNPRTEILVNVGSQTENSIASNTTEIYTGKIHDADGQISFTENIDDKARIWIDGELVLSDDTWSARTSTPNLNLTPGWHDIEIRISNGTGGSGPASGIGIGYDPAGGTNWQTLVDPGDGSFLKVNQDNPRGEALLDGTVGDPDEDPVSSLWSLVTGPGSVTFNDPSAIDTTAQFSAWGTYILRLTANDGRGPVSDDVTITVNPPNTTYSVTYDGNGSDGGSVPADPSSPYPASSIVNVLGNTGSLVRTNHTFNQWNTAANGSGTTYAPGDSFTINADTVLYAQWTPDSPLESGVSYVGTQQNFEAPTNDPAVGWRNPSPAKTLDGDGDDILGTDGYRVGGNGQAISLPAYVTSVTNATTNYVNQTSSYFDNPADPSGPDILAGWSGRSSNGVLTTIVFGAGAPSTVRLGIIHDPNWDVSFGTLTYTLAQTVGGDASGTTPTLTNSGNGFDYTCFDIHDIQAGDTYELRVTRGTAAWGQYSALTFDSVVISIPTYTVSYDGNGSDDGSVPVDLASPHTEGSTVTVEGTGTMSRTGHSFAGWNTAANGSGTAYAPGDSFTINADTVLYAQWTPASYPVTYLGNGNTGGSTPADQTKIFGVDLAIAGAGSLMREGHGFSGWNTASDGSGIDYAANETYSENAALTLHAQWNASPIVDAGPDQTVALTGSAAWTPANLTTLAWYDAADPESVIATSGTVSQWNDKSGNNRTIAQGTQSLQPAYAADTVSFDGTDDYLWNNAPFMHANGQVDVFVVAGIAPTQDDRLLSEGSSSNINPLYCIAQTDNVDASVMSVYIRNDAGGTGGVLSSQPDLSAPGAFDDTRKLYQWKDTGKEVSGRVNGGTATSSAYTRAGTLTMNRFAMGAVLRSNAQNQLNADVNEIVISNNLSESDRLRMEGYLAHRWGLASGLPADHPYRNAAPTNSSATVTLDGTVADPEQDPYSTTWSVASAPVGAAPVAFNDPSALDTTATFHSEGTYVLELTADDGSGQAIDQVTITVGPAGTGLVDHFVISSIATPQTVGTEITGITITAMDAGDQVATSFNGTVTFGGTSGVSGTSASFTNGVLAGVSITPTTAGDNLTFTVEDDAGNTGGASFDVLSLFDGWSGADFANVLTDPAPDADPDGDGLSNLQEFAFGTDPTAGYPGPIQIDPDGRVTEPGMPILASDAEPAQPASYRAVFSRRKDHQLAGLSYAVEFSADLALWTSSNTGLVVLSNESTGNVEAVSVPFPSTVPVFAGGPAQHPRFFRVAVVLTP